MTLSAGYERLESVLGLCFTRKELLWQVGLPHIFLCVHSFSLSLALSIYKTLSLSLSLSIVLSLTLILILITLALFSSLFLYLVV